jgi:hypothetical protein
MRDLVAIWEAYEPVAHRSALGLSTGAHKSSKIPVTAMDLGDKLGHAEGQDLPSLAAGSRPPCCRRHPREWLSENHQVYFLLNLVDELVLSEIMIPPQSKDPRGEKGFDPRM